MKIYYWIVVALLGGLGGACAVVLWPDHPFLAGGLGGFFVAWLISRRTG